MSPQERLNGSDYLRHTNTAEVATVKHDLTVDVVNKCTFDVSSDRALRKSSLSHNALAGRVTRVTQRSVFGRGVSKVIHRLVCGGYKTVQIFSRCACDRYGIRLNKHSNKREKVCCP
jgi:hypothetical protein